MQPHTGQCLNSSILDNQVEKTSKTMVSQTTTHALWGWQQSEKFQLTQYWKKIEKNRLCNYPACKTKE